MYITLLATGVFAARLIYLIAIRQSVYLAGSYRCLCCTTDLLNRDKAVCITLVATGVFAARLIYLIAMRQSVYNAASYRCLCCTTDLLNRDEAKCI